MSLLPETMLPENIAIGRVNPDGTVSINHQYWLLLYNIVQNSIGSNGSISDEYLEILVDSDTDVATTDAIQTARNLANLQLTNDQALPVYPLPLDVSNALQLAIAAGLVNDNTPTQAVDAMSSPQFVAVKLGSRIWASPKAGLLESDGTLFYLTDASLCRASIQRTLFTQTQSVTVANTVTETTIIGTGTGSVTLPANYGLLGKNILIEGFGYHSAGGNPTIQIRIYKGSTLLLDTTAVTSGNGTNNLIQIRANICWRSTTSVFAQGFYQESGGGSNNFEMVNTAATTVNATAEALNITATWGTAAVGNTITLTNLTIRECN